MSLVTSTPTSNFVAAEVNRLIILRAVFGWSGTHPALWDCYAGNFRLAREDERRAKIILRWTFGTLWR